MLNDQKNQIDFLTPDEVAALLKISKVSVYRLVETRKISFYRVRGSLRFLKKDIMDYLEKNRTEAKW